MTKMKFLRLKYKKSQEQLGRESNTKRWKIALAENGFMLFAGSERNRVAEVLRTSPERLLEEAKVKE